MVHGLHPSRGLSPFGLGISSGVDNILDAYLINPVASKTNPMAGRNVTTWNGDEAYEDRALVLPETIMDWMFTANQTFYTERVLPWRVVKDIHVRWSTWEANAHYLSPNPHQAPAPLISQKRTKHMASLIRRGIMFQIEDDWANTPEGHDSIWIGIGQIQRSYQETANAEVIRALLHASHVYQQYVRENGKVRRLDHLEYLKRQRDYFAYFQKDKNAPELWDNRTDAEANIYQGKFDTIILPETMYSYITMVRPEKTDYYLRGPQGPASLDRAGGIDIRGNLLADSKEPREWMKSGKSVYQARAFHVEGADILELLAKNVQIGEYNWMTDEYCTYNNCSYTSEQRDIMIFDEDRDRYSRIRLADAVKNCGLWDAEGNLKANDQFQLGNTTRDADFHKDFLTKLVRNADGTYSPAAVEHLGDIGTMFINDKMLVNAAETMVCALYPDRNAREVADAAFTTAVGSQKGVDPAVFTDAQMTGGINMTFNKALKICGGSRNKWSGRTNDAKGGLFKVNKNGGAVVIEMEMNDMARAARDMFTDILPANEQIRANMDTLFAKATSKEQLASDIGDYLAKHAVGAGRSFTTEARLMDWFKPRAEQQLMNNPEIKLQKRVVNFPIGSQLPANAQWIDPEHASPVGAATGYEFPQSVDEFLSIGALTEFGKNNEGLERHKQQYRDNAGGAGMFDEYFKIISDLPISVMRKYALIYFLGCPVTLAGMLGLDMNNILFPWNFLLPRPYATYRGRTAIKVLSGCGNTYYCAGHSEIGHDAARMISLIHSVAYMAAIIDKPQHVWAEGNLYVDRYFGGLGVRFFTPETHANRSANGNLDSIICIALPYVETHDKLPNPIDIAGRYYTEYDQGLLDMRENNELHYSTAYRYNMMYQFYNASSAMDTQNYPTVIPEDVHMNRICWAGAQFMFNGVSNKFDFYEYNTSPWGELVYPGCGRVRDGKETYLDPQRLSAMLSHHK